MIINVDLADRSYDIHIEKGILSEINSIIPLDRKVLIVTDDGVPSDYAETVAKQCKSHVIVTVKQGEGSKSFSTLKELCVVMLENNFTRNDCVIAVGGGVVGDLSGFAAATFMRGIDFYNIPTTVLSQVDSSIGGKVAINLDGVKNIVGTFYQPKAVIIDPEVLNTLSERQFSNGLAEAVKMGLTSDVSLFELIEKNNANDCIEEIIYKSLMVKKCVVENDEKENGLRRILNFGHTIGHAIESLNLGDLYHGECVGLGMLYMCSENIRPRIKKMLEKLNLPTFIPLDTSEIALVISHDKKSVGELISAVFVDDIGSYRIEKVTQDYLIDLL